MTVEGGGGLLFFCFVVRFTIQSFSNKLGALQAKKRRATANHTHRVGPAYPNVCYSEASVWSLLLLK